MDGSKTMSSKDSKSKGSAFTSYPDDEPKGFGKSIKARKQKSKSQGTKTKERAPVLPYDFDAAVYLDINTDVAKAGIDAAVHYVYQGLAEGRAYQWPPGMPDDEKSKAKARKGEY